jgi:hypothetical protein
MDFTLDYSPDLASMWCCLAVASAFLIGAVVALALRPEQMSRQVAQAG